MESENSVPCCKGPPLIPTLSQMLPVRALPPHFPKIHSSIVFSSPLSSAEVKEWVELYLHSPNTPSWLYAQLKKAHE
jgi:hypothetical protein